MVWSWCAKLTKIQSWQETPGTEQLLNQEELLGLCLSCAFTKLSVASENLQGVKVSPKLPCSWETVSSHLARTSSPRVSHMEKSAWEATNLCCVALRDITSDPPTLAPKGHSKKFQTQSSLVAQSLKIWHCHCCGLTLIPGPELLPVDMVGCVTMLYSRKYLQSCCILNQIIPSIPCIFLFAILQHIIYKCLSKEVGNGCVSACPMQNFILYND